MAKFVLVFKGGAPKEEEKEQNMKDWGDWIAELSGKGVYLGGYPFGMGRKMVNSDNSVTDYTGDASGYSLIEAGSMDEAVEIAKTGPNQKYGGSTKVFDTWEMGNMPS